MMNATGFTRKLKIALAAAALGCTIGIAGAQTYTAQVVTPPSGLDSVAALSQNGHVTGQMGSPNGLVPFVWSPDKGFVQLSTSRNAWASPRGINNSDDVCGQNWPGGISQLSAVWWPKAGKMTSLEGSADARGINDLPVSSGGPQIVGYYTAPKSGWWLSQVVSGKRKEITIGTDGMPLGISQSGAVCGTQIYNWSQPDVNSTLWRWFPSTSNGTATGSREALNIPGSYAACKINGNGDCAVGIYRYSGNGFHGYLWLRGVAGLVDLGRMGDDFPAPYGNGSSLYAASINDSRSIVGNATYYLFDHWDDADPANPRPIYNQYATAFLWTPNADPMTGGAITDLNNVSVTGLPPGYKITGATDINNAGQILVTFTDLLGNAGAAVLTPTP